MPSEPETHLLPEIVTQSRHSYCLAEGIHTPIENEGEYSWEWKQHHLMGPLLYGIESWNAGKDI